MNPEDIRDRVLVIDRTIPTLISEREELIADLRLQGFSLIEEMQPHTPQEDGAINLDGVSDSEKFSLITQRTKFECIVPHGHWYKKGKIYTVCHIGVDDGSVAIKKKYGGFEWFCVGDNGDRSLFKHFKIVSLNGE